MEAIVLGIDGTGVFNRKDYREEMGSSFVSYLVRRTPARLKKYVRGPGWDGLDMSIIVDKAYAFVHLSVVTRPQAPVFLTGYSRGGAGVVGSRGDSQTTASKSAPWSCSIPWTVRLPSTAPRFPTTWSA